LNDDLAPDGFAQLRERLAAKVVAANGIRSERVAAALHAVPRHLFLPDLEPKAAYQDEAIVTRRNEAGQPISSSSQPAIMAIMLYQLGLAPGHRVLEIGAGTGYNAALMSHIVGPSGQVTSVDIEPELVASARAHLADAGFGAVTVVCADGAGGDLERAPYDRVIATVGVSDLAPAWLAQAAPGARIVVPLDVRGNQVSVAFEHAGSDGPWTSRSLAPCGFMRMRGSLAGPERVVPLAPGLSLLLPDGTPEVDGPQVAALLDGPPVPHPTGVRAAAAAVFWGLGLWLAAREPRAFRLNEERPPGRRAVRAGGLIAGAPLRSRGWRATLGLLDTGGLAILVAVAPSDGSGLFTLGVNGFGPQAEQLAADLAAQVEAWGEAGLPGLEGLHIDAYPRPAALPSGVGDVMVMERPANRFAVYHD
jgi:protein-L-isoaspartate(D-aspartate) O-methyltransferase